jgi:hypothetical protein
MTSTARFDQLLAQFLLGGAGVRRRVGHDEAGVTVAVQGRVEELNPQVVGLVGARQAEGEAAAGAHHVLEPLLVDRVDVEGRIGEDEIELAGGSVRVVVIAVDVAAMANVAFQSVHGEVEAAQAAGFVGLFDAADGQFGSRILLMLGDKARRLHEHAAGAAGGVENAAMEGFDDFAEQPDDAARRVELAAALALAHGEGAEEVFVDAAESVVVERRRNLGDFLQQLLEQGVGEQVVGLRQHAGERPVVLRRRQKARPCEPGYLLDFLWWVG